MAGNARGGDLAFNANYYVRSCGFTLGSIGYCMSPCRMHVKSLDFGELLYCIVW